MKKLFLLASLCVATFAPAATKIDLEKVIRNLDVPVAEQIIASEKFTPHEYNRYLTLAEEMVRNREIWLMKIYTMDDVTTPYEGPTNGQVGLELGVSIDLLIISGVISGVAYWGPEVPRKAKIAALIGGIAGAILFWKFLCDNKKMDHMWEKRNKLLRKKYDDAVTIKQLMYTANIAENPS